MARYIDADKLYNRVKTNTNPYGKPNLDYESGVKVLEMIKQEPTADVVEVKHGHWIKHGNEKKCSVCEFIYYSNNDDWNGCPNCLSKMDGERK